MAVSQEAEERAARAIHESYFGKGSYAKATPTDRSHARHTLRMAMEALDGGKPKLQQAPPPASKSPMNFIRPPSQAVARKN